MYDIFDERYRCVAIVVRSVPEAYRKSYFVATFDQSHLDAVLTYFLGWQPSQNNEGLKIMLSASATKAV